MADKPLAVEIGPFQRLRDPVDARRKIDRVRLAEAVLQAVEGGLDGGRVVGLAVARRAKKEEISLVIGLSLFFTVIMMVAMPLVIREAGIDPIVGGAWIGGTIDAWPTLDEDLSFEGILAGRYGHR